ncbi:hypothetical protein DIPPA_20506 [Diplonema papillatum]|nr:hypothetical protein DIPPA_20506 [Diplonema papillatum]
MDVWISQVGESIEDAVRVAAEVDGYVSDLVRTAAELFLFDGAKVPAGGLQLLLRTPRGSTAPLANRTRIAATGIPALFSPDTPPATSSTASLIIAPKPTRTDPSASWNTAGSRMHLQDTPASSPGRDRPLYQPLSRPVEQPAAPVVPCGLRAGAVCRTKGDWTVVLHDFYQRYAPEALPAVPYVLRHYSGAADGCDQPQEEDAAEDPAAVGGLAQLWSALLKRHGVAQCYASKARRDVAELTIAAVLSSVVASCERVTVALTHPCGVKHLQIGGSPQSIAARAELPAGVVGELLVQVPERGPAGPDSVGSESTEARRILREVSKSNARSLASMRRLLENTIGSEDFHKVFDSTVEGVPSVVSDGEDEDILLPDHSSPREQSRIVEQRPAAKPEPAPEESLKAAGPASRDSSSDSKPDPRKQPAASPTERSSGSFEHPQESVRKLLESIGAMPVGPPRVAFVPPTAAEVREFLSASSGRLVSVSERDQPPGSPADHDQDTVDTTRKSDSLVRKFVETVGTQPVSDTNSNPSLSQFIPASSTASPKVRRRKSNQSARNSLQDTTPECLEVIKNAVHAVEVANMEAERSSPSTSHPSEYNDIDTESSEGEVNVGLTTVDLKRQYSEIAQCEVSSGNQIRKLLDMASVTPMTDMAFKQLSPRIDLCTRPMTPREKESARQKKKSMSLRSSGVVRTNSRGLRTESKLEAHRRESESRQSLNAIKTVDTSSQENIRGFLTSIVADETASEPRHSPRDGRLTPRDGRSPREGRLTPRGSRKRSPRSPRGSVSEGRGEEGGEMKPLVLDREEKRVREVVVREEMSVVFREVDILQFETSEFSSTTGRLKDREREEEDRVPTTGSLNSRPRKHSQPNGFGTPSHSYGSPRPISSPTNNVERRTPLSDIPSDPPPPYLQRRRTSKEGIPALNLNLLNKPTPVQAPAKDPALAPDSAGVKSSSSASTPKAHIPVLNLNKVNTASPATTARHVDENGGADDDGSDGKGNGSTARSGSAGSSAVASAREPGQGAGSDSGGEPALEDIEKVIPPEIMALLTTGVLGTQRCSVKRKMPFLGNNAKASDEVRDMLSTLKGK